jgi:microsomal dipeptidase-like Zn-dependent dipeptidase
MWAEGMDLQYLVLTHLSHIPGHVTANHAYGAKFLKSELKYPVGMGLTEEGKRVIDTAYHMIFKVDKKNNIVKNVWDVEKLTEDLTIWDGRVLIDIKHMSLKARQDFYEYRKELVENRKSKEVLPPIIASHVGVTGYSVSEWIDALNNAEKGKANVPVVKVKTEAREAGQWGKIPRSFHFNPWTINLMDDDIIEIAKSGGLIGVSLDARLLGFVSRAKDLFSEGVYEFLSFEEFRHYFPYHNVKGLPLESIEAGLESELFPNKYESHMLVFCFNILHIVSVIENYVRLPEDRSPWDFVCIGSDFDGLIDPLKHVRDASKFGKLKGELKKWLPIAYKSYEESNGGVEGLESSLRGEELNKNIQKFLFENGESFVSRLNGSRPKAPDQQKRAKA